jgi:hypothetical protein
MSGENETSFHCSETLSRDMPHEPIDWLGEVAPEEFVD